MKKLLILGSGQYGKVAKEIAEAMECYDSIDFLDDNNQQAIGKLNEYEKFSSEYDHAVVAIGNAALRLELINKLGRSGFEIPVLIHPKAYVSPSAVVEHGTFIEPMTVIHTDVKLGIGCIISAGTIINHNAVVGDGCHLNCGTLVRARAEILSETRTDYGQIIG